jgi:hypothetical protein
VPVIYDPATTRASEGRRAPPPGNTIPDARMIGGPHLLGGIRCRPAPNGEQLPSVGDELDQDQGSAASTTTCATAPIQFARVTRPARRSCR